MQGLELTDLEGKRITIDAGAVEAFAANTRGAVLRPGDPGYDDARRSGTP